MDTKNAPSVAGAWNDFVLGLKGKFPSLEEALTHRSSERRLINLHDPQTRYDPAHHRVTYQRDGEEHTLPVDPAFKGYMRRYASRTHYVTDNGTPWLTRRQEYRQSVSKKQLDAYYEALNTGKNREVAMVNWSGTHIYQSGHSSVSVGTLNLVDGSSEEDEIPLYRYEPEITGSYYGSLGLAVGMHPDAYRNSAHAKTVEHSPLAHAAGTMLRDGAWPLSAMLAGIATGTMITANGLKKQERNRLIKTTLRAMTALVVTAAAGAATGYLANSNGTLLMKEEALGSGLLATLITPAQRDILEHALYGVYKTYEGKYNILHSNCADFSEKMLAEIQVDIASVIESAMRQEPPKSALGRVRDVLSVPHYIRPDRAGWAMRMLPDSKPVTGVVALAPLPVEHVPHRFTERIRRNGRPLKANGGEELHISPNVATNAPTLLVETTQEKFDRPPIETFREALKHVTLRADAKGKYRWELMPHVQLVEKEAPQLRPH